MGIVRGCDAEPGTEHGDRLQHGLSRGDSAAGLRLVRVFFICRSDYRRHHYCSEECREAGTGRARREANARLRRAGCDRDLFTTDAVAMIHEAATGGMRDVDRLATASLREAA